MRMWSILLLAIVAVVGVPIGGRQPPERRPLPGRGTEIDRLVGKPVLAYYCDGIGYVDLGAAVDGPAYYFRESDGKVIARCGGYCEANTGSCQNRCPPPEAKCR